MDKASWLIQVPCCSTLPDAKDGVEPSFQDLQSDTFPLCYLAKPATSLPKSNGFSSFPAPSLSTYAVAGGALYMTGGGLPKEGKTSFSLALLNLPFSFWNVSSRFWAAHPVSSAITAESPCGCSAAYSPSTYLTLPKHILDFISFSFPASFFLSIGRVRADRAGGDWCSLSWGMPFRWVVPLSVFSIQCPHCVRRSSSSISLHNAIKKSNSFSRCLSCLLSYWSHIYKQGVRVHY